MDRVTVLLGWRDGRKPHVCGDGPPSERWGMKHTAKTPRMWGWTERRKPDYQPAGRKPHVCGDGPILDEQEVRLTQ